MHTFDSSLYFCFHKFNLALYFDLLNDLLNDQFRKSYKEKNNCVFQRDNQYNTFFKIVHQLIRGIFNDGIYYKTQGRLESQNSGELGVTKWQSLYLDSIFLR